MNLTRNLGRVLAALLLLVVVSCSLSDPDGSPARIGAPTAAADSLICDQFGTATIKDRYTVSNNRFGSQSGTQCIALTENGFRVDRMSGTPDVNWMPIGYPSIFYGCHWGKCSPSASLPKQLSQINRVASSAAFGFVDGPKYKAAYDIWLDPNPAAPGVQQMEIMVFFNGDGVGATPPDKLAGEVSIGGRDWQVISLGPWATGGREFIYTGNSRIPFWEFDVMDFVRDVRNRGYLRDDWYLTSVQAGLECYTPCPGASLDSFSVDVA